MRRTLALAEREIVMLKSQLVVVRSVCATLRADLTKHGDHEWQEHMAEVREVINEFEADYDGVVS